MACHECWVWGSRFVVGHFGAGLPRPHLQLPGLLREGWKARAREVGYSMLKHSEKLSTRFGWLSRQEHRRLNPSCSDSISGEG